jgi:hypothetical protein
VDKTALGPRFSNLQHRKLDDNGTEEVPEGKLHPHTEPFFRSLLDQSELIAAVNRCATQKQNGIACPYVSDPALGERHVPHPLLHSLIR